MHTLLGYIKTVCIRAFTKDNPCTDLKIITYTFVVISNLSQASQTHNQHTRSSHFVRHTFLAPPLPNDLLLIQVQASLNTMVQNHVETIPWTQYLGSTLLTRYHGPKPQVQLPRTKYHRPKIGSPTCMRFSLCESACIRIRAFVTSNPRVYMAWSR